MSFKNGRKRMKYKVMDNSDYKDKEFLEKLGVKLGQLFQEGKTK